MHPNEQVVRDFYRAFAARDAEANLAWDYSAGFSGKGRLYAVWTSEFPDESDDMKLLQPKF